MTYRGQIRNGGVVLDQPSGLPEGTEVLVQPVEPPTTATAAEATATIWQKLLELEGAAQVLPSDLPERHDLLPPKTP